jgi:hypothetical protein
MTSRSVKRQLRARGLTGQSPWRRPWSEPRWCDFCQHVVIRRVVLRQHGRHGFSHVWVEDRPSRRGWIVWDDDSGWWDDPSFVIQGTRYRRHKC